jgi:hypothetical protein
MKKLNFWLFASLFIAAFTLTACGDDDEDTTTATPPTVPSETSTESVTVDDLKGTWKYDFYGTTYEFTENTFTVKMQDEETYTANYTLKDGVISYSYTFDGKAEKGSANVYLMYNKSVLAMKAKPVDGDDYSIREAATILYRNGQAPNTPKSDIQGEWHWYMRGEVDYVRGAYKFEGDNFELIVTPWGQKYTGTYAYQGGFLTLNITNGYTSREEGTGDGWGEGDLDPKTLECDWKTLNRDRWAFEPGMIAPFIVNGTEAYGALANLPCVFYKK